MIALPSLSILPAALPDVLPPTDGFWLPPPHLDLDAIALTGLMVGLYAVTVLEARRQGLTTPVGRGRMAAFAGGIITLLVGSSWPIHELSEGYLFSVHMVQHMLFMFVAAPLLLWGTPSWLMEILLAPKPVHKFVSVAAQPFVAFMVYNLGQGVTHVPEITNQILQNHTLHYLVHMYIVVSSLLLWFPIICSLPGMPRLSYPMQMVYLMLQSVIPTVVYAPLTYSEEVVYDFYAAAPRIWGIDPLTDQQMAGLLMKIGGGFIVWGWIAVIFFKWAMRSEKHQLEGDFTPLEDLTPTSAIRAAEDVLRQRTS